MEKGYFTRLRKLRKLNDIILDKVAIDTGISIGYLNRIERGYIHDVKNAVKRKKLENYIRKLEIKTKKGLEQQTIPVSLVNYLNR